MSIKQILKRILPKFVIELWRLPPKWVATFTWESVCNRKIAAMKDKEVLTVLFLPANLGMWKYDSLFKKMMEHPRFRPLILPAPVTSLSKSERGKEIQEMKQHFVGRGFPVVDEQSVENTKPDIVFITQAYGGGSAYGLKDFPGALGCYAPYYSFPSSFGKGGLMDSLEQNKLWRLFTQNKASCDARMALMTNKGKNVRMVGYLNADRFLQKDVPFTFSWKLKNPELKKVIYAPHWTIDSNLAFFHSTFLSMGEAMLELAEKYADKIQWCFKPHPWLLRELKKIWGEGRARAYFRRWEELENATRSEGEYISLFMTSDAMIHDCASFRYEYFYTKNPVMYLIQDEQKNLGNDVALKAIGAHYHGHSREDVEKFIEETVLGGNDPKFEERERFLKEYLLPPNNQSVAQNIIDEIERGLGWRK